MGVSPEYFQLDRAKIPLSSRGEANANRRIRIWILHRSYYWRL